MKIFPIIPIWIMIVISILLIAFIIRNKKDIILQISIIILLFIINLRIMIPNNNFKVLSNNLDVLLVVDNTISMLAEDYDGNKTRLEGAKKDLAYIINNLNGSKFSVITFDNTSRINIPYTKDINLTKEAIEIIKPINRLYAKGTSLNTPIDTIISSLKASKKKQNRKRIIFIVSDGEITDDKKLESYKNIKKYITNGAVLGYGTNTGGNMKINDKYYDDDSYVMDSSNNRYEKAVSKIDENNLKTIANDMDIDYINRNNNSNNLDKKLKEIKKEISKDIENDSKSNYDDTYYILTLPLLILLVIQFRKYRSLL